MIRLNQGFVEGEPWRGGSIGGGGGSRETHDKT